MIKLQNGYLQSKHGTLPFSSSSGPEFSDAEAGPVEGAEEAAAASFLSGRLAVWNWA